ncbi:MAG: hypothetical protein WAQ56_08665, partial [Candidatus Nitrotoga sp.]
FIPSSYAGSGCISAARPKLPFGLIEQEMSNRTYLTHKLNRLNSSRCHVAQPAQHRHCIMLSRQRQYTSSGSLMWCESPASIVRKDGTASH